MKTLITSNKVPKGKSAVIRHIQGDLTFISNLRQMGFGESADIRKFGTDAHRCIILNKKGNKICLSNSAAECILVEIL
jgi:hypothetical protein